MLLDNPPRLVPRSDDVEVYFDLTFIEQPILYSAC